MLFNSFFFLFAFLPAVVLVYLQLRMAGMRAVAIALLGLTSYGFYLRGENVYPWLLGLSICVNFILGRWIAIAPFARRKVLLVCGLILNLGVLIFFKYTQFLLDQWTLLGGESNASWVLVLPIGVSFFTFTQIAFLVDVYQGKAEERSFTAYALFISYFPHLVAGPILHHGEMLSQFKANSRLRTAENLLVGLSMLAIGLAKKTLLADPCGVVASEIFGGAVHSEPSFFVAWIGALSYSVQIYFDFSGYSDMAIGVSRMLGINLPINFNSPYKAHNIIEFWRRWHITLSRFLRDYLYVPLGGNRRGRYRRYVNLFVTMLLGGLWHGAGWAFIIWGVLHGLAQSFVHGIEELRRTYKFSRLPVAASWLFTMTFVTFAWVAFRSPTLETSVSMWRGMLGLAGFAVPSIDPFARLAYALGAQAVGFGISNLLTLFIAIFLAVSAPNSQELMHKYSPGLDSPKYNAFGRAAPAWLSLGANWKTVLVVGVLLGLSLRAIGGYSEFLYFQF